MSLFCKEYLQFNKTNNPIENGKRTQKHRSQKNKEIPVTLKDIKQCLTSLKNKC